jgi:N-acetylglucosaminyldiphosphoundecaprenol N-acetyl-beta-D-mannosaminyltransferase
MKQRVNALGVGVDPIDMDMALAAIRIALDNRDKGYVCLVGVHGIMEALKDSVLRSVFKNALMVVPDGMPTVWIGRSQGFRGMKRVFGPDLMMRVLGQPELSDRTHFLCGGADGVAEELRDRLVVQYPRVKIVGTYTPPFRTMNAEEEANFAEMIASLRPDIIWVGMSTPKQDFFMSHYLPKLDTSLMIGVGAAFLFHTGRIRDSPTWIKQAGLQWLHRLIQEPRRLWKRYLLCNGRFLVNILLKVTGLKKYPLESSERTKDERVAGD